MACEVGTCKKKCYLVGYNAACLVAWSLVALGITNSIMSKPRIFDFEAVRFKVQVAQTISVIEILNAVSGIVRAPIGTTFAQVASRLHLVWIIWRLVGPVATSAACLSTISAWTAVELIRYPFYILNVMGTSCVPFWLKWLRYSAFIVLYPIGIMSEVICILTALPYFKSDDGLRFFPSRMPNRINFEINLSYLYIFILLAYIPGSVMLYCHMLAQRKKVLLSDTTPVDDAKKST